MNHKWSWSRFLYGAVGASAPEIYRITRTADLSLVNAHPYLIAMSIAFVLIGGVFASAWGDEWPLKSIYVGATFPIWVSAWTHMVTH
jgi:hypothetical protein